MAVVLGFALMSLTSLQAQNRAARKPVTERPHVLRLARHQSKSPLQWYGIDLVIYLIHHPSPNSSCDGAHYADLGGEIWGEACDWRIQVSL